MKDLHCRDVGSRFVAPSGHWNCDFVARGGSNDEIVKKESEHAKAVHYMTMGPELTKKAESLIHDEASEAHRQAMSPQSRES